MLLLPGTPPHTRVFHRASLAETSCVPVLPCASVAMCFFLVLGFILGCFDHPIKSVEAGGDCTTCTCTWRTHSLDVSSCTIRSSSVWSVMLSVSQNVSLLRGARAHTHTQNQRFPEMRAAHVITNNWKIPLECPQSTWEELKDASESVVWKGRKSRMVNRKAWFVA